MKKEKWLLVGHRGAGKSSFLREQAKNFEICLDLDLEVEKRSKKTILEIFDKIGEAGFRQLEAATLETVLSELSGKDSVLIALGAGFGGHIWPRDYRCLWLRKESDIWPRYFLDRPGVGTSLPYSFLENFIEREKRYQSWADCAWTLPEGYGALSPSDLEAKWPLDHVFDSDAHLTLVPRLHRNLLESLKLRKSWGLSFELRTDLWAWTEIERALEIANDYKFLLSFRSGRPELLPVAKLKQIPNIRFDWELSLGSPPAELKVDIFSSHDFAKGLSVGLQDLERFARRLPQALLKASPIIDRFEDLIILEKWRQEDPKQRCIFPRSRATADLPLWQWFRLLLKGRQPLNFVREASEGLKDQPTLAQYIGHCEGDSFAALLGDPVMHSYSPLMHREFFKKRGMSFLSIPISKESLTAEVLSFLEGLGAKAFAVTSPHKQNLELMKFSAAGEAFAEKIFNTLVRTPSGWQRFNTDIVAIKKILSGLDSEAFWRIWGSGAMAQQCFEHLDYAAIYSSRSAEQIKIKGEVEGRRECLLWAAGDLAPRPPKEWKPLRVVDLSYNLRSEARLYALEEKLDYVSGLEFFKVQALEQQAHWNDL